MQLFSAEKQGVIRRITKVMNTQENLEQHGRAFEESSDSAPEADSVARSPPDSQASVTGRGAEQDT